MKSESLVFLLVIAVLAGAVWLTHRMHGTTVGRVYVETKSVVEGRVDSLSETALIQQRDKIAGDASLSPEQRDAALAALNGRVAFSWERTFGIWIAAFLTLATLSFLYRDNPVYRFAEHVFVGVSAAYWMTIAFWDTVVPNLLGKLFPAFTKTYFTPGLDLDGIVNKLDSSPITVPFDPVFGYSAANGDGLSASWLQLMDPWYIVPLVMGVMLLWRLAPAGAWIARWPLAFIIGTTAGLRLIAYLEADFLKQIEATMIPVWEPQHDAQGQFDFGSTFYVSIMQNLLIVVGTLTGLVYFFFSLEHKGLVGRTARVGIWFLMITFGAGFGYTVMGRIALLLGRFEFLVKDWLNLIS
jgi:hypothetical protein